MARHATPADERQCIMRKVERMAKVTSSKDAFGVLIGLLGWLEDRHERCAKRKGGVGRR